MVAAAAGCSSDPDQPRAAPTTTTAAPAPLPLPAGFEGEFVAMAGDEINNAGLSRLTFSPPELEPLTGVRRVSAVSACPTAVIVAAAQESVNFSDHIQVLAGDRLVPVPGLGAPFGFAPDLDGACRLVYFDSGGDKALEHRIWRFDPQSTAPAVLHTSHAIGGVVWGPGGQVAAVETTRSEPGSPARVTGIRLLQPDGSSRMVAPVTPDPGPFEWGASGWMAFGVDDGATVLLHADSRERRELAGWVPLAWSPEGQRLLVVGPRDWRDLGVVDLADITSVTPLGRAPE
ncbi:MAG: hypothetical protein ACRDY7_03250, partial [Acidimicrobiia bacterium]